MGFEIEKGIPVPARSSSGGYPWKDMQVGDSFVFPCADKRYYGRIASAMQDRNEKFPDTKFISRTDKATSSVRVWRVK